MAAAAHVHSEGAAAAADEPGVAAAAGSDGLEDYVMETTEVNLSERGLTAFPQGLFNLVFLHFLDISKNSILEIPPEIGYLSNLYHVPNEKKKRKKD
jgi:hypothetical protein